LAYRTKQNRTTQQRLDRQLKTINQQQEQDNPMHGPPGNTVQPTIFISWRMSECPREVKALQAALEEYGFKIIVIGELPGSDLLEAVSKGMDEAALFVVMGTETYGIKTSGSIDTYKEMQFIQSSGKPCFLINMNPEESLMKFKEASTNVIFNLNSELWARWELGTPMAAGLPAEIVERLHFSNARIQSTSEVETDFAVGITHDTSEIKHGTSGNNQFLANLEKREVHLNEQIAAQVALARKMNGAKDKKGALFCLKKKKVFEGEITKIQTSRLAFEQSRMRHIKVI
jgi:hypothetical protein